MAADHLTWNDNKEGEAYRRGIGDEGAGAFCGHPGRYSKFLAISAAGSRGLRYGSLLCLRWLITIEGVYLRCKVSQHPLSS